MLQSYTQETKHNPMFKSQNHQTFKQMQFLLYNFYMPAVCDWGWIIGEEIINQFPILFDMTSSLRTEIDTSWIVHQ